MVPLVMTNARFEFGGGLAWVSLPGVGELPLSIWTVAKELSDTTDWFREHCMPDDGLSTMDCRSSRLGVVRR